MRGRAEPNLLVGNWGSRPGVFGAELIEWARGQHIFVFKTQPLDWNVGSKYKKLLPPDPFPQFSTENPWSRPTVSL